MEEIILIPIGKFKFNGEGKYLVKTISLSPLKTKNYLCVRVKFNHKKNQPIIDINGQTVTHISKNPLKL
jgi:hypothetical protein